MNKLKLPTDWMEIKLVSEDKDNYYFQFVSPDNLDWLPEGECSAKIMIP